MTLSIRYFASKPTDYPADLHSFIAPASIRKAVREIESFAAYQPTPLRSFPALARELGVAEILYKDESKRFGLTSFKAVGGAYAVPRLLAEDLPAGIPLAEILSGCHAPLVAHKTMACATAGNHGLAVAWAARSSGCKCIVYMHAGVPIIRETAIRAAGAEVIRTAGNYDQSVQQLDHDARHAGWQVVADTAYPGYEIIPSLIMQGYCVISHEILKSEQPAPATHIFLQVGVGTFAAAIAAHFWIRFGRRRPKIILVEPREADCFQQSLEHGVPSEASGDLSTIMTGLSTRGISTSAWAILRHCTDAAVTIDDGLCRDALAALRSGAFGSRDLDAGPSGVAGLAALMAMAGNAQIRQTLGIDAGSRILTFGTEGPNGVD